jgi:hypothetical protein
MVKHHSKGEFATSADNIDLPVRNVPYGGGEAEMQKMSASCRIHNPNPLVRREVHR